jgi:hypothetical protein
MKIASLITLCIFTLNIQATEIPQRLLDRVANDIDNICGDAWCEGDFNWGHTNLKCELSKGLCTIDLNLIDELYVEDLDTGDDLNPISNIQILADRKRYESEMIALYKDMSMENDDYARQLIFSRSCTITDMFTISDVVTGNTYSNKLVEAVVDCVSDMEIEYWDREIVGNITSKIKVCGDVKVLDTKMTKAFGNININNRSYFNEFEAWLDLNKYLTDATSVESPRESSLWSMIYNTPMDQKNECKRLMDSLNTSFYILAINTHQSTWSLPKVTKLLSFTLKRIDKRVKILIEQTR